MNGCRTGQSPRKSILWTVRWGQHYEPYFLTVHMYALQEDEVQGSRTTFFFSFFSLVSDMS